MIVTHLSWWLPSVYSLPVVFFVVVVVVYFFTPCFKWLFNKVLVLDTYKIPFFFVFFYFKYSIWFRLIETVCVSWKQQYHLTMIDSHYLISLTRLELDCVKNILNVFLQSKQCLLNVLFIIRKNISHELMIVSTHYAKYNLRVLLCRWCIIYSVYTVYDIIFEWQFKFTVLK